MSCTYLKLAVEKELADLGGHPFGPLERILLGAKYRLRPEIS